MNMVSEIAVNKSYLSQCRRERSSLVGEMRIPNGGILNLESKDREKGILGSWCSFIGSSTSI